MSFWHLEILGVAFGGLGALGSVAAAAFKSHKRQRRRSNALRETGVGTANLDLAASFLDSAMARRKVPIPGSTSHILLDTKPIPEVSENGYRGAADARRLAPKVLMGRDIPNRK